MKKDKMQICLANLHFFYAIELRTKVSCSKKLKYIWFFAHLFVPLQPNKPKQVKNYGRLPGGNF